MADSDDAPVPTLVDTDLADTDDAPVPTLVDTDLADAQAGGAVADTDDAPVPTLVDTDLADTDDAPVPTLGDTDDAPIPTLVDTDLADTDDAPIPTLVDTDDAPIPSLVDTDLADTDDAPVPTLVDTDDAPIPTLVDTDLADAQASGAVADTDDGPVPTLVDTDDAPIPTLVDTDLADTDDAPVPTLVDTDDAPVPTLVDTDLADTDDAPVPTLVDTDLADTDDAPVPTLVDTDDAPVPTLVDTDDAPVPTLVDTDLADTDDAPVPTLVDTDDAPVPTLVDTDDAPIPTLVDTDLVDTDDAPVPTLVDTDLADTDDAPVPTLVDTDDAPVPTLVDTDDAAVPTLVDTDDAPIPTLVDTDDAPIPTLVDTDLADAQAGGAVADTDDAPVPTLVDTDLADAQAGGAVADTDDAPVPTLVDTDLASTNGEATELEGSVVPISTDIGDQVGSETQQGDAGGQPVTSGGGVMGGTPVPPYSEAVSASGQADDDAAVQFAPSAMDAATALANSGSAPTAQVNSGAALVDESVSNQSQAAGLPQNVSDVMAAAIQPFSSAVQALNDATGGVFSQSADAIRQAFEDDFNAVLGRQAGPTTAQSPLDAATALANSGAAGVQEAVAAQSQSPMDIMAAAATQPFATAVKALDDATGGALSQSAGAIRQAFEDDVNAVLGRSASTSAPQSPLDAATALANSGAAGVQEAVAAQSQSPMDIMAAAATQPFASAVKALDDATGGALSQSAGAIRQAFEDDFNAVLGRGSVAVGAQGGDTGTVGGLGAAMSAQEAAAQPQSAFDVMAAAAQPLSDAARSIDDATGNALSQTAAAVQQRLQEDYNTVTGQGDAGAAAPGSPVDAAVGLANSGAAGVQEATAAQQQSAFDVMAAAAQPLSDAARSIDDATGNALSQTAAAVQQRLQEDYNTVTGQGDAGAAAPGSPVDAAVGLANSGAAATQDATGTQPLTLSELKDQAMASISGAAKSIDDATGGALSAISQYWEEIRPAYPSEYASAYVDAANQAVQSVSDAANQTVQSLSAGAKSIDDATGGALSAISQYWEEIRPAYPSEYPAAYSDAANLVSNAASQTVQSLSTAAKSIDGATGGALSAISQYWEEIRPAYPSEYPAAYSDAANLVSDAANQTVQSVSDAANQTAQSFSLASKSIDEATGGALSAISQYWEEIRPAYPSEYPAAYSDAANLVSNAASQTVQSLSTAAKSIDGATGGALSAISQYWEEIRPAYPSEYPAAYSDAANLVSDAANQTVQSVSDTATAVQQELQEGYSTLTGQVQSGVDQAYQSAADLQQKAQDEYNAVTGQVQSGVDQAYQSAADLQQKAQDEYNAVTGQVQSGVDQAYQSAADLQQKAQDEYNAVTGQVQSGVDQAYQSAADLQQKAQDEYNALTGQGGAAPTAPQSAAGAQDATGAPPQTPGDVLASAAKPFTDAAKSLDDATGGALSQTAAAVQQRLQDDYNTVTGQGGTGATAPQSNLDAATALANSGAAGAQAATGAEPQTPSDVLAAATQPLSDAARSIDDATGGALSQTAAAVQQRLQEDYNTLTGQGGAGAAAPQSSGQPQTPADVLAAAAQPFTDAAKSLDDATGGALSQSAGTIRQAFEDESNAVLGQQSGAATGGAVTYDDLSDDQKNYALALFRSISSSDAAGMQAANDAAAAAGLSPATQTEVANIVRDQMIPANSEVLKDAQEQGTGTVTYDDLSDDQKNYALALFRSISSSDAAGMQAANDAAAAAGLSPATQTEVANIVRDQMIPANSEVLKDAQEQGTGTVTYDDLSDDQKNYALALFRSISSSDAAGMQAANDAAAAAGLSPATQTEVANIVRDQMIPANSEVLKDAQEQGTGTVTYDDLSDDQKNYALALFRSISSSDAAGMQAANDAAAAAGLSPATQTEVANIVRDQMIPANSEVLKDAQEQGTGTVTYDAGASSLVDDASPTDQDAPTTVPPYYSPGFPGPVPTPDFASLSQADMAQAQNVALDTMTKYLNPDTPDASSPSPAFQALSDNQKSYSDFVANRIMNVLQLPPDWSMQPPGGLQSPAGVDVSAGSGAGSGVDVSAGSGAGSGGSAAASPTDQDAPTTLPPYYSPGFPGPVPTPDFASLSQADMAQAQNVALDTMTKYLNPDTPDASSPSPAFQALSDNQKSYSDFVANRIMNVLQLPPDWSMQPPGGLQSPAGVDVSAGSGAGSGGGAGETDGDARSVIPEGASGGEAGSTPAKAVDAASSADAAPTMTYDDLNDAEKTYALSLARSMATLDFPGMQAASDAATAAGLTEDQKLQAAYIVQYQDTPAIGEAAQQAQSQILGTQDGAPARTYDDLNDDEKTYASSLARSMATLDFPGMQAASDAATAAGLSDSQKAQVAYIVQYQDTPAIGEAVNQVRAELGVTQDGADAPARTFDDLNQAEQAYALSLARPMAAADVGGMQAAGDAATVAGLSDDQKAQVAYIVQTQLTPGTSAASGSAGLWSGAADNSGDVAPTFLDAQSGGGVASDVGAAEGGAGPTFLDVHVGSDVGAEGGGAGLTVPEGAAGGGVGSGTTPVDADPYPQPIVNFEDLSDGQKNYAAQMDQALASGSIPAVQAARDAVNASGLSDSEIAQVNNMFNYQNAESNITATKEAYAEAAIPPTRTYDDLNDAEKAYADKMIQDSASGTYYDGPMLVENAKASGLSNDQINEVTKIVNWQTEGPPADPYPQPIVNFEDLSDGQKNYAAQMDQALASGSIPAVQAARDAVNASGLSDSEIAQVNNMFNYQNAESNITATKEAYAEAAIPPTRTYDDLNDAEKAYADKMIQDSASGTYYDGPMLVENAKASGLSNDQINEVTKIVNWQTEGPPADPYPQPIVNFEDLSDGQKNYAAQMDQALASGSIPAVQAARDAVNASGLSDSEIAQVNNMFNYQNAESNITATKEAYAEAAIPPTRTYDDLNDAEKAYADKMIQDSASGTYYDGPMLVENAKASGLSNDQINEVTKIVNWQTEGPPADPYPQPIVNFEDLSDGQKNYAAQMDQALASGSIPAVQAARDAVNASGLSDSEIAQVNNMFNYQNAESNITATKEAYAEAAIPPTRTYDDLNDAEKAYADKMIQDSASGTYYDGPMLVENAKASGLSNDQINEVTKIVNWQTEGPPADPYPQPPQTASP